MNKAEVAEQLSCSTRQVEKYVGAGRLGVKEYIRGKHGREAVYDAAEVERLRGELERERAEVIGRPSAGALEKVRGAAVQGEQAGRALELLAAINERLGALQLPAASTNGHAHETLAEVDLKLTLSVAEAARLSGFSPGALREAIAARKLKAKIIKGRRGWTIKREDLDLYVKKL